MFNKSSPQFKRTLRHMNNIHGGQFSWVNNDFEELMLMHENQHHNHLRNLTHCGVWNKKHQKPCENKAIVRLTFQNNTQIDLCNAHTLNVSRVMQNQWSEIGIERINL